MGYEPGGSPHTRGATIVVADDDASVRAHVGAVLDPLGCRIVEADSDALYVIRMERPAVAILDMSLGDVDGLRIARAIRRSDPLRRTRLVVPTGHASPEAERAAQDAGVDAFIAKPFSPADLQAVVERLLLA